MVTTSAPVCPKCGQATYIDRDVDGERRVCYSGHTVADIPRVNLNGVKEAMETPVTAPPKPDEREPETPIPPHKTRRLRPEEYKCDLCPDLEPFSKPTQKARHIKQVHPTPKQALAEMFSCQYCEKSIKGAAGKVEHERWCLHNPERVAKHEPQPIDPEVLAKKLRLPSEVVQQRAEMLLAWLEMEWASVPEPVDAVAQIRALKFVLGRQS